MAPSPDRTTLSKHDSLMLGRKSSAKALQVIHDEPTDHEHWQSIRPAATHSSAIPVAIISRPGVWRFVSADFDSHCPT